MMHFEKGLTTELKASPERLFKCQADYEGCSVLSGWNKLLGLV